MGVGIKKSLHMEEVRKKEICRNNCYGSSYCTFDVNLDKKD